MKTIKFILKYITDSEFRFWVDMKSAQKYVDDMKRMFDEQQIHQARKIFSMPERNLGCLSYVKKGQIIDCSCGKCF